MTKLTFINPKTLDKITSRANKLSARWDYPKDQYWQLWNMVATIESGLATITRYQDSGIVVEGWNRDPDPYRAWGGFYRQEKNQMVGWTLWLVKAASPEDRLSEMDRIKLVYGFHQLYWEDQPSVWGWVGGQDFYQEKDAKSKLQELQTGLGTRFKRHTLKLSEMSGCWQLWVEATKKTRLNLDWKSRITKD